VLLIQKLFIDWELDNKDYVITNNGKIAAKLTDAISTLFSAGPQFDANHIIEFKVIKQRDFIIYIIRRVLIYL